MKNHKTFMNQNGKIVMLDADYLPDSQKAKLKEIDNQVEKPAILKERKNAKSNT